MTEDERHQYLIDHPIYETDLSKPPWEIIEGLRNQITRVRGQLGDIARAYPAWEDRLEHIDGLLTCGLVVLYHEMKEMERVLAERWKDPTTPKKTE